MSKSLRSVVFAALAVLGLAAAGTIVAGQWSHDESLSKCTAEPTMLALNKSVENYMIRAGGMGAMLLKDTPAGKELLKFKLDRETITLDQVDRDVRATVCFVDLTYMGNFSRIVYRVQSTASGSPMVTLVNAP